MITYNSKRFESKYGKILNNIFDNACDFLGQKEKINVNLYFVSNKKMKYINNKYRQVNNTTDVLSFPLLDLSENKIITKENFKTDFNSLDNSILLGEIFISPRIANLQAKKFGHGKNREYAFLFLHGLLHLFGYDHIQKDDETVMNSLQKIILIKCEVPRE